MFSAADDGDAGVEVWRTDGTPAGTTLVADISAGPYSTGELAHFTRYRHNVLLTASQYFQHARPFIIEADSIPSVIARVDGGLGDGGWFTTTASVEFEIDSSGSSELGLVGCDGGTVATDTSGVSFSCAASSDVGTGSAIITVRKDGTPPDLSCPPAPVLLTDDEASGATPLTARVVTTGDATSGLATVTVSPLPPFPNGRTQVSLIATDLAGNGSSCAFAVDVSSDAGSTDAGASDAGEATDAGPVIDTTPPTLSCPANVATSFGESGARVQFTPTATDDHDATPEVLSSPLSGSFFPIGTTKVTVTARDDAGNQAQCTFEVTVTQPGEGCGCTTGSPSAMGALLAFVAAALGRIRRAR